MVYGFDMSTPAYSTDGRCFRPVEVPHLRGPTSVAFDPHDASTAYLLFWCGASPTKHESDHNFGLWRTRDRGRTWHQIYRPRRSTYRSVVPWGKRHVVIEPTPARRGHVYFGSPTNGLVRSTDDGKAWEVAAFRGRIVKTLAIAARPAGGTVLYAIVGPEVPVHSDGKYRPFHTILKTHATNLLPEGELWRVDVSAQPPYDVTVRRLHPELADFVDVEVDPGDPSRGLVIRKGFHNRYPRGGRELHRFSSWGETLGPLVRDKRSASASGLEAVFFSPWNPRHVVLYCSGKLQYALQFSTDGGKTWNAPRRVVDGRCPDFVSYNPYNHNSPDGAMPNAFVQGQGRCVAFIRDNPRAVLWWTQNFGKTPLRSDDYGQTFRPFAYGGPFKQGCQIAVAPGEAVRGTARGEYGFVVTEDGGMSWRGSTKENDPSLAQFFAKMREAGGKYTAASKFAWGLAFKPDEHKVAVGLYGSVKHLVSSTDGGVSWQDTGFTAGGVGCVYWHRQNTDVVYAADHKSVDAGRTWKPIGRLVLAVSASNGNAVLGHRGPVRVKRDSVLSVSTDAGESWTDLPPLPKETMPGTTHRLTVTRISTTCGAQPDHAADIDPSPQHDPTLSEDRRLRILVAGRRGAYEFSAANRSGSEGHWSVHSEGLAPSRYFCVVEPVPWLGRVVFDPRPGMSHVVYACKTTHRLTLDYWRLSINANLPYLPGQPHRPLYRSIDGGRTWRSLHAPHFSGIANYLDVTAMEVGPDGTVHVDGFHGLYSLPGPKE